MILHYASARTSIADLGLGLAIHIKLIREQNLRSTWRPYLVPRYAMKRDSEKKKMIESSHGVPLCNSCGGKVRSRPMGGVCGMSHV